MKRTFHFAIAFALAGVMAAPAAAQSLGDYARQQRAKKPPSTASVKEYTNDNLPTSGGLGVASSSASTSASTPAGGSQADAAPEKERNKQEAAVKAKFAAQREVIAKLQRELEVAERENSSRQAQTQSNSQDLGSRLRNPVLWAAENKKYQDEIDGKKKELEAAKQQVEDMREDLRKAGLPSSWGD